VDHSPRKYKPISTVSRSQVLREFHTLKLESDGDLEAHFRNFHTIKRKLDEQGIKFDDSVLSQRSYHPYPKNTPLQQALSKQMI
jgi:hypothetical protein